MKTKPVTYLLIITGFIMIISLCIITKNKSERNNNYNQKVFKTKDTLKIDTNSIEGSIVDEILDLLPIKTSTWINLRSRVYIF